MKRYWMITTCLVGLILAASSESVELVETSERVPTTAAPSTEPILTDCPKIDSNKTILLAHESDCTRYYACSNGKKIPMVCPWMDTHGHRLYFSIKSHKCEWPQNSDCTSISPDTPTPSSTEHSHLSDSPTTPESHSTLESTTGPPESTARSEETTLQVTQSPPPESTIVPAESTARPEETTVQVTQSPPPGSTAAPPESTVRPAETTLQVTHSPPPESTTHPSKNPGPVDPGLSDLCPPNGSKNGESYPHECSCEKYYTCSLAGLVLHQCSNKTFFNPSTNSCDKPENVNCSPVTQPPPTTEVIPTECPIVDPPVPVKIAHPNNCTLYYRCVKGEKVLKSCSSPLQFNPKLQLCDWPESAGCRAQEETTSTTPLASSTVKPFSCPVGNNRTLIPHETMCSMFYICDKGQKKLAGCVPGLEFNPVLRVCDWPATAGCSKPGEGTTKAVSMNGRDDSVEPLDERNHQHNHNQSHDDRGCIGKCPRRNSKEVIQLAHRDCNKFCKCHSGKPRVINCPRELNYNPVERICDSPQNAGCKGRDRHVSDDHSDTA